MRLPTEAAAFSAWLCKSFGKQESRVWIYSGDRPFSYGDLVLCPRGPPPPPPPFPYLFPTSPSHVVFPAPPFSTASLSRRPGVSLFDADFPPREPTPRAFKPPAKPWPPLTRRAWLRARGCLPRVLPFFFFKLCRWKSSLRGEQQISVIADARSESTIKFLIRHWWLRAPDYALARLWSVCRKKFLFPMWM